MNNEIFKAEMQRLRLQEPPKSDKPLKIVSGTKARKHNHFPQGKTGYVPRGCSNPVNVRMAKRR